MRKFISIAMVSAVLVVGSSHVYTINNMTKQAKEIEKLQTTNEYYKSVLDDVKVDNKDLRGKINNLQIETDYNQKQIFMLKGKIKELEKRKLVSAKKKVSKTESTVLGTFRITHYSPKCLGCSGITTSGYDVRNTIYYKGMRIIASDNTLLPNGTIVEIDNGKEKFKAISLDTGGAIKGHKIDLLVSTQSEGYRLGVYKAKVTVLQRNVKIELNR